MKSARLLLIVLICLAVAILSFIVYDRETKTREYKEDLVELSKVKYGLFNVDEWKNILESIVQKKIEEFNFEELPKEEIRMKIQTLLYKITGDLKTSFYEEKGVIPRSVANITGIFSKMESEVPAITNTIMDFVEKPENRQAIRDFALKKLDDLTDSTFSQVDYSLYDAVIEEHGCRDKAATIEDLNDHINESNAKARNYQILLFILAGITGLILLFGRNFSKWEFFFITLITVCFLATGLLLPMIEIDARVSQMNFSVLGEPIIFEDQILYYKNKSILEVVEVMIFQERVDLIIVGSLVLLFSVMFPLAKLISSVFYMFWDRVRRSSFMKFIIFRTGKWSMADVMVLAIFMAFIGFSGILREQLQQIEIVSRNLELFTTNESKLQVGFFAFLSFAVLSLLVAHKLQYEFKTDKKEVLEEKIEEVEKPKPRKKV